MWCIGLDLDLIPIGSSVHSHATASRLDPDAAQVQVSLTLPSSRILCQGRVDCASGKEREKTLVFYTKLKAVTIRTNWQFVD